MLSSRRGKGGGVGDGNGVGDGGEDGDRGVPNCTTWLADVYSSRVQITGFRVLPVCIDGLLLFLRVWACFFYSIHNYCLPARQ